MATLSKRSGHRPSTTSSQMTEPASLHSRHTFKAFSASQAAAYIPGIPELNTLKIDTLTVQMRSIFYQLNI